MTAISRNILEIMAVVPSVEAFFNDPNLCFVNPELVENQTNSRILVPILHGVSKNHHVCLFHQT